jgi:hypothetical protein
MEIHELQSAAKELLDKYPPELPGTRKAMIT